MVEGSQQERERQEDGKESQIPDELSTDNTKTVLPNTLTRPPRMNDAETMGEARRLNQDTDSPFAEHVEVFSSSPQGQRSYSLGSKTEKGGKYTDAQLLSNLSSNDELTAVATALGVTLSDPEAIGVSNPMAGAPSGQQTLTGVTPKQLAKLEKKKQILDNLVSGFGGSSITHWGNLEVNWAAMPDLLLEKEIGTLKDRLEGLIQPSLHDLVLAGLSEPKTQVKANSLGLWIDGADKDYKPTESDVRKLLAIVLKFGTEEMKKDLNEKAGEGMPALLKAARKHVSDILDNGSNSLSDRTLLTNKLLDWAKKV